MHVCGDSSSISIHSVFLLCVVSVVCRLRCGSPRDSRAADELPVADE